MRPSPVPHLCQALLCEVLRSVARRMCCGNGPGSGRLLLAAVLPLACQLGVRGVKLALQARRQRSLRRQLVLQRRLRRADHPAGHGVRA
jgi:hypothetical protein